MDAELVGKLRVEGAAEEMALADEDRKTVELGQHLACAVDGLDDGGSDEDGADGLVDAGNGEVRLEAPFGGDVGVMVTSLIGQRSTIARRRLIVFTTDEIDSEHER